MIQNTNIKKDQFLMFLHSIDEGFVLIDSSWNVVDLNDKAWRKMGMQVDRNSIGQNFLDVFPSARDTKRLEVYKEVLKTGESAFITDEVIGDNLSTGIFKIHVYRVGDGLGLIVSDITEQKRQEAELIRRHEQLRELNENLQKSKELERAAIAREIHDELGQELTALKFELHWLSRKMLPDQSLLREKSRELVDKADDLIKVIRSITSRLRLEYLETHSLPDALRLKSGEFQKRTGIDTSISIESEHLEIARDAAVVFYRILQESLTNIARHADATKAEVSYFCDDDSAYLSIKDDGRGIAEDELRAPGAFGLMGMRERCDYMKGRLRITGSPGTGTSVEVMLPLL